MKQIMILVAGSWLLVTGSVAQTVSQKLQKAFAAFEKDPQLKHAISSLYVIDAKTGQVVFDKNSQIGLAPASTQKIITSVTAFELLGKDYRYKTELGYNGELKNRMLKGNLYIIGYGDPTFGSWRYQSTKDTIVINELAKAISNSNLIQEISGDIFSYEKHFESIPIPDGWIVQDIGNYYGAGASSLNWRENQFDIVLESGNKIGGSVKIKSPRSEYFPDMIVNEVTAAAEGTGDNAFIYPSLVYESMIIRGTIPINQKEFRISGAEFSASSNFLSELYKFLPRYSVTTQHTRLSDSATDISQLPKLKTFYTHYSPSLDSIIYWFNKKSINLYGEALIKTFAYEKNGFGSTDSGVVIVKKFWKEKGISENEINIVDGSGLSPLNRVTTQAQVEILKYAKNKDWFPYFYNSLPEYNKMTMKSGTIRGVKGFCGYHKAKNGKEYIFSFLVNNYNGSAASLVSKMYKVLDILK